MRIPWWLRNLKYIIPSVYLVICISLILLEEYLVQARIVDSSMVDGPGLIHLTRYPQWLPLPGTEVEVVPPWLVVVNRALSLVKVAVFYGASVILCLGSGYDYLAGKWPGSGILYLLLASGGTPGVILLACIGLLIGAATQYFIVKIISDFIIKKYYSLRTENPSGIDV